MRSPRLTALLIGMLAVAVTATPASAFWGQGKLKKAWRGTKQAAHWVQKKVENGKNQERGHQLGR